MRLFFLVARKGCGAGVFAFLASIDSFAKPATDSGTHNKTRYRQRKQKRRSNFLLRRLLCLQVEGTLDEAPFLTQLTLEDLAVCISWKRFGAQFNLHRYFERGEMLTHECLQITFGDA